MHVIEFHLALPVACRRRHFRVAEWTLAEAEAVRWRRKNRKAVACAQALGPDAGRRRSASKLHATLLVASPVRSSGCTRTPGRPISFVYEKALRSRARRARATAFYADAPPEPEHDCWRAAPAGAAAVARRTR